MKEVSVTYKGRRKETKLQPADNRMAAVASYTNSIEDSAALAARSRREALVKAQIALALAKLEPTALPAQPEKPDRHPSDHNPKEHPKMQNPPAISFTPTPGAVKKHPVAATTVAAKSTSGMKPIKTAESTVVAKPRRGQGHLRSTFRKNIREAIAAGQ